MNPTPITIDCQYVHPQFAAAYLIQTEKRKTGPGSNLASEAAFVENNTAHCVPILLKKLEQQNIRLEDARYLIVTHIHLDHAGGSSDLMAACPNATLLVHPRAAKHIIDPSTLVASAKKVYGEKAFEELYGQINPIPSDRVRAMEDGESLPFGSGNLKFIFTRGHANHHFCIFDSSSGGVFTGDSFGLAYPTLQKHGLFIFPSTSPTDFDPKEARQSIQKIMSLEAQRAYLTHFGEITQLEAASAQLLEHLDYHEHLLERAIRSHEADEDLDAYCETDLKNYFQNVLEKKHLASDPQAWNYLQMDVQLNAQGIAHVARKRRAVRIT